ncbi:lysozyme family protein [Aeromonas hydrophila]|uniref:hypothetical protein n=1 Tax=Aeromonas hydrophila TaxID=644 RepID=UPI002B4A783C|nr:hypothetical protein [Aeromonas hydrophila]
MLKKLTIILMAISQPVLSSGEIVIPKGYHVFAEQYKVPVKLLYAVAMNESLHPTSHKRAIPWPWTANVDGKSYRFNSREELYNFSNELISTGKRSIDICASQINWYWNHKRFKNLYEATDPAICLETSAKILSENHAKTNNWIMAAAIYHNPSSEAKQQRYIKSLKKNLKYIDGDLDFNFTYVPYENGPIPTPPMDKIKKTKQPIEKNNAVNIASSRKIIIVE